MRVSIHDIQAPVYLPDVVAVAEEAGYHRYWVSEHYAPAQSASPTLTTALAAGISQRIRVGMAGVLLRYHSPARVASDVALLTSFFPNRIDLGVVSATVPGELAARLGLTAVDSPAYRARVIELLRLVTDEPLLPCSAFATAPQLWICGTSPDSARLAGTLGFSYAYHHHLGGRAPTKEVAAIYRDAFRSLRSGDAPYFGVAAYGIVNPGVSASDLERWRVGAFGGLQASFSGSADECTEQIQQLRASYDADEMFIDCFAPEPELRIDALRAVAIGLGL
jgi:alkanesulfonate monooxygenase SsuD/methylene tetrahydromethanopterin reductase-like flavin-dependent oxidoreductase (luciferase family)